MKKKKSDDIDLLGDLHASHSQNNSNKIQKNNINLFEDPEPVKGNLYDKDHFNSFSGVGAKSSHIDFESVWNEEKEKKHPKKEESFSEFQNINMNTHSQNNYNKNATNSYPANNNNLQYPIHQQNPYYPQQHVTMNINMNMYPNVMNINVNGTNNNVPNASPLNQINFSEPITL